MILISHRGNINGKNNNMENNPDYIDNAIKLNYQVEIDIMVDDFDHIYLGHDNFQYVINETWLNDRISSLWVHCKNVKSFLFMVNMNENYNYFWHQTDILTLTSHKYMWVYPGYQPIKGSIAVLPEINNDDVSSCLGICSDHIEKYKIYR